MDAAPQLLQSPRDLNKYKFLTLPNGLQALLLQDVLAEGDDEDSASRLAGAALSIATGTLMEPRHRYGLAHFL